MWTNGRYERQNMVLKPWYRSTRDFRHGLGIVVGVDTKNADGLELNQDSLLGVLCLNINGWLSSII